MKLADYAKAIGISYQTAWRHFKAGKIPYPTKQLDTGTYSSIAVKRSLSPPLGALHHRSQTGDESAIAWNALLCGTIARTAFRNAFQT
ncbi:hypothetical protein WA1_15245 [Scytonema hofmannii PCC 7110]|uniref:Uncharacterized protein n=1 Tax=Scytonema hofmannii PCC 7110 TaxID=128403 RepID=A0A139XDD6_9CYAN|nr:hypothetical protein WA1_15245 [Scytonema hofmannii PCC 7110]